MNISFKVIGLAPLGIKPESTAPEADALPTYPSEVICTSCWQLQLGINALAKFRFSFFYFALLLTHFKESKLSLRCCL